jgi:DNA-binding transcriptional LysR family regulator
VLESAMLAHGLAVTPLVELGSTTAIKLAIASGAGPGVLSQLAVDTEVREGRLVVIPLEDLAIKRSIRAVWVKGRSLSSSAKRLLRHVSTPAP